MHLLTLLLCVADLAKSRHCFFAIFSFNFHMWLLLLFFFLCVVGTTPRATLQFSTRFRITSSAAPIAGTLFYRSISAGTTRNGKKETK